MSKKWSLFFILWLGISVATANDFKVGTGIYDVTGPAAEVGMMGYARLDQQTSGIHHRLWARAFVIEDLNGKRFVFVNLDIGMVMQAVKIKVIENLQKKYGNLYSHENVMLAATHTHSGPGGFSHYALYNITILGFCEQNFNAVVNGICGAIDKAHQNVAPAQIFVNKGKVNDAVRNRSIEAYNANMDGKSNEPYDETMTLLKFQRPNGQDIGMISWFGIHATSMGNENKLINGDNKGWAQRKFDMEKGSDYRAEETFVSAFANSTLGDVTPNIYGGQDGGGINDFASTNISGEKQFETAWQLYHNATQQVAANTLDYRHIFADFSDMTVDGKYTDGKERKTGYAALGIAFAAGAEDGPSDIPYIKEGDYKGHYDEVHGLKPIFLEMGKMTPFPWTPEVLPVQVFTLGNIAILAVPGEFTTQSGRRIKETVLPILAKRGIDHIVIAGPANSYAGYVTTREEYNEQHYEGASTHFGQWTLGAFREQLAFLAESLVNGKSVPKGPSPRDLSDHQTEIQPGVIFDTAPFFKDFGDIKKDAPETVERLSILKVEFWGAHPKNNLRTNDSFLEIQKETDEGWEVVRYDYDLDTAFIWKRSGISNSEITVLWDVPIDIESGVYRILHSGFYKDGLSGEITPYSGYSRKFSLTPCKQIKITNCVVQGNTVKFQMKYPPATQDDLHHRKEYVEDGQIQFSINDTKKLYTAKAVKGQNIFIATVDETVNTIHVGSQGATDMYGNGNEEFTWKR